MDELQQSPAYRGLPLSINPGIHGMCGQRHSQRGIGVIGVMMLVAVVGFFGLVALRVLPTVNEYTTIRRTVEKLATNSPGTVPEIRAAFDRQTQIDATITSISGKDLTITKERDRVVIAFTYEKEIELMSPVSLLIMYPGRSN